MNKLAGLKPTAVFEYFEKISSIPRGSGNMDRISEFCVNFAKEHSLNYYLDEAKNVIIRKDAAAGYESVPPIILQGHLDMVCQKTPEKNIDFEKDGIDLYIDGDFVKADGTTLGADNGIAVAMLLAILEDKELKHPPLEVIFTTDEEIGLIGAGRLNAGEIKGARMINIDAEEFDKLTVSCAGGSDFKMTMPVKRKKIQGKKLEISLFGLKGGHSGIEIGNGRVNANILAGRILNFANKFSDFELISVDGGTKGNAITNECKIVAVIKDETKCVSEIKDYIDGIKEEISLREPDFDFSVTLSKQGEFDVFSDENRDKLVFTLMAVPNGVMEMSATTENLVETSLNLGILETKEEEYSLFFALRSNILSALCYIEERLKTIAEAGGYEVETSGHYPPWEFSKDSYMQNLYVTTFNDMFGYKPEIVSIHAGLECGIFSNKIKDIDCIAIGPDIFGAHTVNEKLSISSTEKMYGLITELLEKMK